MGCYSVLACNKHLHAYVIYPCADYPCANMQVMIRAGILCQIYAPGQFRNWTENIWRISPFENIQLVRFESELGFDPETDNVT